MAPRYMQVRFHVDENSDTERGAALEARRGIRPAAERPRFLNDESAARFFLGGLLENESRVGLRGIAAPERPAVVPDLRLQQVQESPLTDTRIVSFDQVRTAIPIFGTRAIVELDQNRNLIGVNAHLTEIPDVSAVATLSPAEALSRIEGASGTQIDPDAVTPPHLTFFQREEDETWHLAYLFRKLPATPPDQDAMDDGHGSHGHGLASSPRERHAQFDYLVDAHDGEILFTYSATPLAVASPGPLPATCRGIDEDGAEHEFFGHGLAAGFELLDPFRSIRTYDLGMADLEDTTKFPSAAVSHPGFDFVDSQKAAVSAHVNAMRVYDFYKGVLKRDSIDDRGMELVSVVNCTSPSDQAPPEWHNAVWWNDRMWYGQKANGQGALVSLSRFLDVIAHELTHGVTETSSDLVYRDQSGALNESFSDIFGVIISNATLKGLNSDPRNWSWELGTGLGRNGLPLRDLSDPTRTGDPAHMNDFLHTKRDHGAVHTNSNIHNKAAFNVLTAVNGSGALVFRPEEVAILYYLTLVRLNRMATFRDTLLLLLDVARTVYPDPAQRDPRLQALRDAYQAVGIAEA